MLVVETEGVDAEMPIMAASKNIVRFIKFLIISV